MPPPINEVVHYLRSTLLQHDEAGLTDGHLLGRFIEHRDQAAVAALVRRHGSMVWGVCRRVLGNEHDAEDAFQATFLVLIRKAASVRQRELVGNWLYSVAHQTALKARVNRAQRRTRERQVTDMPETTLMQPDASGDLQALLDQELSRLPDKYRVAIVLCDLEGKTRREVARQLGLPEGTLAGRLTRGRALLVRRLHSRGAAVSGGTLTAALAQQTATAGVPPALLSSTIEAVMLIAVGQAAPGLVSTQVAGLSEGVVKAMLLSKLKIATAVLFLVAAVGAGVATRARDGQTQASEPATAPSTTLPKGKRVSESSKPQSDPEAIQGRWKVVAWEIDGWREPTEEVTGVRITPGKVFIRQNREQTEYTYTLDPAHSPRHIDWVGTEQVQVESSGRTPFEVKTRKYTLQGIYRLDGDNLALCLRRADKKGNRPTKFETQPEDGGWLLVLRRERPIVTPEGGASVPPRMYYEPKGPATKREPRKQAETALPPTRTADSQGTASARAPAKPDVVFRTESRHIQLPVRFFADQRQNIEELQLFASTDEGKTWRYVAILGRNSDHFDFGVPHDGVYWFSVRTINRDGTAEPRDLSALSATLKLQVAAEKAQPPEKPKPPQSPQKSVEELKAEVKTLRRQLRQIEQRLSEMERAR